jgi:hypothetical protein
MLTTIRYSQLSLMRAGMIPRQAGRRSPDGALRTVTTRETPRRELAR